jgi:Protein of unknown function (DUF1569)
VSAVHPAFQEMSDAFATKLAGKSGERCQIHPFGTGAWSTQEVIEHLVLTYRGTVAQTEKYRQRGSPSERKAKWNQTAARILVVGLGRFPLGVPAPEFARPGQGGMPAMCGDALAALLQEELSRLDSQLVRCAQVFGKQAFAPHFRLGPLSAQQWRKFHLVHGWHHLAQVKRIEAQIRSQGGG